MDALEPWHLIVVAIVAVILFFGWKQLPDMSRSLGRSLRLFKTELHTLQDTCGQATAAVAEIGATLTDKENQDNVA